MADWDPFADPAVDAGPEEVPTSHNCCVGVATTSGIGDGQEKRSEPEDLFAMLRAPRPEKHACSEEEFAGLLDNLFAVDDANLNAIEGAMRPVSAAIRANGILYASLWKRLLPVISAMEEENSKLQSGSTKEKQEGSGPQRKNLFTSICNSVFHLSGRVEDVTEPSEVIIGTPAGGAAFSGVVVFLLGWGGGTVHDLADITGLYEDLFPGAVVVRLTCASGLGLRLEVAQAVEAAAKAWSVSAEMPKLLVHLFSNGGFMTWTTMLLMWEDLSRGDGAGGAHPQLGMTLPSMAVVLRGVIYDSAPNCSISVENAIQSNVQTLAVLIGAVAGGDHDGSEAGKKAAEARAMTAILTVIGPTSPFKAVMQSVPEKVITKQSCVDGRTVHRLEPPVHTQYFYSRDDTIISFSGVEKYIEEVEARPSRRGFALPMRKVFEKSKHCFHKVNHRPEYFNIVQNFSTNVLAS